MKNKYSLTREENIFLARKRWDESIYSGMRMESRNVTFPQTQTILEGINVAGVELDDIQAILNMRDAWKYLLDAIDEPLNIEFLCKIQERIAYREALAWGTLRTGSIGISGVKYVPPIPKWDKAEDELKSILAENASATEIALDVFAWVARSQLFWDGNKRTAMLAANKLLIEAGAGILLVPDEAMVDFSTELSAYYETGDSQALKSLLYETSIFGISASVEEGGVSSSMTSTAGSESEPEKRTAAWLKVQRKKRGLTQKDLAESIGIATNSLANIEQGQRKGSLEVWEKIEHYFDGLLYL